MNLETIYKTLFYISNKDQKGHRLSPTELNTLFPLVDTMVMNKLLGIKSPVNSITSQVIHEINQSVTDKVKRFKVIKGFDNSVPLIANLGHAVLPTDYLYPSSISFINDYNEPIEIEALTDNEYVSRLNDALAKPDLDYPICNFQNNALYVMPKTITRIDFIYIRKPITAFFDYYISPTIGVVYLPFGVQHPLLAGEEYRDGTTTGTVTGISKELDFNEEMHPEYIMEVLKLMGINLRDTELFQAISEQQNS